MSIETKNIGEMVEPGYYWWLPEMFRGDDEAFRMEENWSIISWHPLNDQRQKSGQFLGPIRRWYKDED